MKQIKKPIRAQWVIAGDILLAGILLIVFALFHHVLPSKLADAPALDYTQEDGGTDWQIPDDKLPTASVLPTAESTPEAQTASATVQPEPTAVPTEKPEPTAEPTPAPTPEPTPEPTAEPTPTPEPTEPPVPYTAAVSDKKWSELTDLAVVNSADEFKEVIKFLKDYNDQQEDDEDKLLNVWLGAQYLQAKDAPDKKTESWYWTDTEKTMLLTTDPNWAEGQGLYVKDAKLMLRYSEENGWQYYGVKEDDFNPTDYPNSGYLTEIVSQ